MKRRFYRMLAIIGILSVLWMNACTAADPSSAGPGSESSEAVTESVDESGSETEANLPTGKFLVGFGRKPAMPDGSVIMSNYGVKRYSTGYYNKIYVNCIAMTDEEGTTYLCYSLDISGTANHSVFNSIKAQLKEKYGIDSEHVHLPNTHNHSAVALGADGSSCAENHAYINKLIKVCVETADLAMADRKEVSSVQVGTGEAEGMTYIRLYRMSDGSIIGDNYNSAYGKTGLEYVSHASVREPDRTIQLIRFNREEGKDIVMMGWRSHNHLQGGSSNTVLMGGFPTATVEYMESQDPEINVVYFQEDAGHLNPTSKIASEDIVEGVASAPLDVYGKMLGDYAFEGLKNMETVQTGPIRTIKYNYVGEANHDKRELLNYAQEIYTEFQAGRISASEGMRLCVEKNKELGLSYVDGLHSVYHCGAIISQAAKPATSDLTLYAVSIGPDIGLTYSAYEMFDSNGQYIRKNSPFKMTMTICYTEQTPSDSSGGGYIPDKEACELGCYEADRTPFVYGTAEILADKYLEMLGDLKSEYK